MSKRYLVVRFGGQCVTIVYNSKTLKDSSAFKFMVTTLRVGDDYTARFTNRKPPSNLVTEWDDITSMADGDLGW